MLDVDVRKLVSEVKAYQVAKVEKQKEPSKHIWESGQRSDYGNAQGISDGETVNTSCQILAKICKFQV
ncbi:hypothetical protein [Actinobacillus indolicus]|uniref:hypothetical protein n=1 Tax=Actinobacillus indolicus TaxID=51049 RepID=UPI0013C3588F|nr:hypothetical protein [Actinobacillus indolicus]